MLKISHFSLLATLSLPAGEAAAQSLPLPAPAPTVGQPRVRKTPAAPVPGLPAGAPPLQASPEPSPTAAVPQPTEEPIIIIEPAQPSVGGIPIDGLKDAAALLALRAGLGQKLQVPVKLWDGGRQFWIPRTRLGATIPYIALIQAARGSGQDVPVRFHINVAVARQTLAQLAPHLYRRARRVSLDVENGQVASHGGDGLRLDVTATTQRVKQALEMSPPRGSVQMVVRHETLAPADSQLQQFGYLLASYATGYPASIRGRTHNLRIAARNVNGTIVPDGGVFSTNRAIGPRNAADGWREAQMFVSGQVVSGVGAGICQCASTLYNAALLADLPIVERHPHMFRVTYVPASRDATIYWGSKDMRFRNNTGGPIHVQTFLAGGKFHVRLYGTRPRQHQVEVVAHTLSRRNGTVSEAYRIVQTPEGNVRERLSRDHYRPHP